MSADARNHLTHDMLSVHLSKVCFQTFLDWKKIKNMSVDATCMKERHCADDILGYGMDESNLISGVLINISNLLSHIMVLFNIIIFVYFATSVIYIESIFGISFIYCWLGLPLT
mgnify:CR=1 FL=1